MKKSYLALILSVASVGAVFAGVPTVTDVQVVRASNRLLRMEYTFAGGPAIVMLSVMTNGVPVDGANLTAVSGDINTIVSSDGRHSFTWHLKDTPLGADQKDLRASVSLVCRPLDNPPDYLVVNLSEKAATPRYLFVEDIDGFSDKIVRDSAYWTDRLVLRRIHARNIPWVMGCEPFSDRGSASASGAPHEVTLTNDYWAAVFQLTRGQWAAVTSRPCPGQYRFSDRRPVDSVFIERADTAREDRAPALRGDMTEAYRYPEVPHPASFLGLLRTRTGLAFDLPGEAMWEFAAKAGTTDEQWGNGTPALRGNLSARFGDNAGLVDGTWPDPATSDITCGTAEVGSYAPNGFGLYDMHGNANELCLDWYEKDAQTQGAINACGGQTLSGADGTANVSKGGALGTTYDGCLPSRRYSVAVGNGGRAEGFRVFIHSLDPRLVK